jgi:hypothetical protein
LNSFLQIEEETLETNQCTCIITFDSTNSSLIIERTVNIPDFDSLPHSSSAIILTLYLSASDQFHVPQNASMVFTPMQTTSSKSFPSYVTSIDSTYPMFVATKKKYKPIAQKVQPVIAELPDHFRIIQNIVGDPLTDMLKLNPHPPPFTPSPHPAIRSNERPSSTKTIPAISYGPKNETLCTISFAIMKQLSRGTKMNMEAFDPISFLPSNFLSSPTPPGSNATF